MSMRIGFGVPVNGRWSQPEFQIEIAQRAEHLGYAGLWAFQRLLVPEAMPEGALPAPYRRVEDPIVMLAFLAGVTKTIRLGLAIVNAPFMAPIVLAKQLATLDIVSGGRLDAGLGLGWVPEEFEATGVDIARRGARIEDYLSCLKKIWTDEIVEHHGEFYSVPRGTVDPKPVQRPHPPIIMGGNAPAALRRVGRVADGWVSSSRVDPRSLGEVIATIREAATEAGRDPDQLRFIIRGAVKIRPAGASDRDLLSGSAAEILGDLEQIEASGATDFFVDLNFDPEWTHDDIDPDQVRDTMRQALEDFAPAT